MELSIDTKIGVIDFSYDKDNDEVIAYLNDGWDEWEGIKDFPNPLVNMLKSMSSTLKLQTIGITARNRIILPFPTIV